MCLSLVVVDWPATWRKSFFFVIFVALGWLGERALKRRRLIHSNIAIDAPLGSFAFSPNSPEWLKYLVVAKKKIYIYFLLPLDNEPIDSQLLFYAPLHPHPSNRAV